MRAAVEERHTLARERYHLQQSQKEAEIRHLVYVAAGGGQL